jgi:hypothetical protein
MPQPPLLAAHLGDAASILMYAVIQMSPQSVPAFLQDRFALPFRNVVQTGSQQVGATYRAVSPE